MSISGRPRTRRWGLGLGVVAVLVSSLAVAADEKSRTIDAGGLTFEVPAAWTSSKPSNAMRKAQLTIKPVEGDSEPAELVVTSFPGGAGGVKANLDRWQKQFRDADDSPPKIETKTVPGKNVEVVRAEVAGRYVAALFPGSPQSNNKPNFRLLGAIVEAGDTTYFIKLVGPEKTMLDARPAFDTLLGTIKAERK